MLSIEQQRIALAEWMGFEWKKSINADSWAWFHTLGDKYSRYGDWSHYPEKDIDVLPDYPQDLNAIHEAEKKLDDTQFHQYCNELQTVIVGSLNPEPNKEYITSMLSASRMSVKAPAPQRLEALCRTLWPEKMKV